jgi:hypothetical protein
VDIWIKQSLRKVTSESGVIVRVMVVHLYENVMNRRF